MRSASPRVELCSTGPAARSMRSATCSRRSLSLRASDWPSKVRAIAGSLHTARCDQSPFRRKRREEPSVNGAAERDRSVGNDEDVTPERVAGPERLHRGDVRAQARADGIAPLSAAHGSAQPRPRPARSERRMTTFDAASGIVRLTTASAQIDFVLIMRGVMCGKLQSTRPCTCVKPGLERASRAPCRNSGQVRVTSLNLGSGNCRRRTLAF